MSYSWKFKVLKCWDEIDDADFIKQWERWTHQAPDAHVFNHPALIKTWTDIYRSLEKISPLYIVAEAEDVLVFLPLVLWQRNWKNAFMKTIIPAGYSDYDYHDPLVVGYPAKKLTQAFWKLLIKEVLKESRLQYDLVDLTGMRTPGVYFKWLKEETCPYVDLSLYQNYDHYFSMLGKSLRKDIRKRIRMLEEFGKLSFHVYGQSDLIAVLDSLPEFLKVHATRWPNAYIPPGFHEALLRNTIPLGLSHFSEIRIDDLPISWELGFRYRKCAYSYMPAYVKKYAKCSPGKVHLSFLLEESFEKGIREFDFMRGSEEYKGKWTDDNRSLYCHKHFDTKLQSRLKLKTREILRSMKG